MALNAVTLKTLIYEKMALKNLDPLNTVGKTERDALFESIAEAIVEHIQSSAIVAIDEGSSVGDYNIT